MGIPGGSVVKNPSANAGGSSLIPGSQRFPGKINGNPLPHSCLGHPMDRGVWKTTVSLSGPQRIGYGNRRGGRSESLFYITDWKINSRKSKYNLIRSHAPWRRWCPVWRGNRYVQIVSYLELLRLQGHGVISPLSPRHGAANLLYSIARPFKIRKNNCKIEVCAFFSGFWVDFFY